MPKLLILEQSSYAKDTASYIIFVPEEISNDKHFFDDRREHIRGNCVWRFFAFLIAK